MGSLLTSVVVLTVVFAAGMPERSAQAQGTAQPETLGFFKECVGLEGDFDFLLVFEFVNGVAAPEDFDRTITLTCGENFYLDIEDLAGPLAYVASECAGDNCPPGFDGTIAVEEQDLPAGTTTTFAGNFTAVCDGTNTIDIVDQTGALAAFFGSTGLLCEITNTAEDGEELADLRIGKICAGEGFDATFTLEVTGPEPGDPPAAIACDGEVLLEDLPAGEYTISETIEGPDADGFVTAIFCTDTEVVGTELTFTLGSENEICVIINLFDPEGDGDGDGDGDGGVLDDLLCPCGGVEIDIDIDNTNSNTIGLNNSNTNNNANNNTNTNDNVNENTNENNNENTNTQDQTNDQDQDNSNTQTNNITSSPEVNIDFD